MLTLSNLKKSFGTIAAVDHLSLEIPKGEVFGLLGPNGAGKSTTVNLAVGLIVPDSGNVSIDGSGSPVDVSVRRKIGVAPQSLAIYEEMSGRENVTFFARLQGLRGRELKKSVDWAMEFVGLADRQHDRSNKYSGGMKRRLNLAVAIAHKPLLLLLDEPTVGVDPQSRNAIFDRILMLREEGCTIVYTTHYMEEAQRLCDRVGIIDGGRLLALDAVESLIAKHGGKRMVIAQTNGKRVEVACDDPLAELQRMQSEGELETFHVERPSLESVFLGLTGRSLRDE